MEAILNGLFLFWNNLMQESFWHKSGQNPFSGYWDILIFMFCAIFSNDLWQ